MVMHEWENWPGEPTAVDEIYWTLINLSSQYLAPVFFFLRAQYLTPFLRGLRWKIKYIK